MKTCIKHFQDLQHDTYDYNQEIYQLELELEELRERLKIQEPSDMIQLQKDISKSNRHISTYPPFVQIYSTIYGEIASKHSEALFNENHIFSGLEEVKNTIHNAGYQDLKQKI